MATGSPASVYDEAFYERLKKGASQSAAVVAPLLVELLRPASVLDVGCGVGSWLAAFAACGVRDLHGIDQPAVDGLELDIPEEWFTAVDITHGFDLGRIFDVVLCLEVAEHLPAEAADPLIANLTRHADVVVFSAAIPNQRGTGHINEQWPAYWAEKFAAIGYEAIDTIRPLLWNDSRVKWWYAQNTIVYASGRRIDSDESLRGLRERAGGIPLPLVHPDKLLAEIQHCEKHHG